MDTRKAWRESQPELHRLMAKVNALVCDPARPECREQWLAWLSEYRELVETGEAAQTEWQERRRRYFEVTAIAGAALRDRKASPDAKQWITYRRDVMQSELPDLPDDLRAFFNPIPRIFAGGQKAADPEVGSVEINAWGPPELESFDKWQLAHDPLPTCDIGREYMLPEIVYGLTVLHDADGAFGRLVPENGEHYWLTGFGFAMDAAKRNASDTWAPSLERLLVHIEAALQAGGGDEAASGTGSSNEGPKQTHKEGVKGKRSTEWGEARTKLIAALTQHHSYADGGCLNLEPIGNNALARLADVDKATASAFFKQQFKGHSKYKSACSDAAGLAAALKLLNGEYAPHHLYGSKPADERERDQE